MVGGILLGQGLEQRRTLLEQGIRQRRTSIGTRVGGKRQLNTGTGVEDRTKLFLQRSTWQKGTFSEQGKRKKETFSPIVPICIQYINYSHIFSS